VLPAILRTPGLTTISTGYAACGPTLGQQVFATELAALAADPASSRGGRIGYVMNFDFGAGSFEPIARIATTAPSMPIREQAIVRLSFQAQSGNGYSAVPAEQVPAWKSFFRDRLPETTSFTRFRAVWRGVRGLRDDGALGAAGAALQRVPMTAESQEQVICQAYALATDVPAAWDAFKLGAEPHTRLSAAAQEALNDPATACAP